MTRMDIAFKVQGGKLVREITRPDPAVVAAVALPLLLGVVTSVADHPRATAAGAADALGPALLPDQGVALGVVDQG